MTQPPENQPGTEDFGKVVVLSLNWNGREFIEECVDSFLELDYPNLEIMIIDNGSTDDSVPFLKERYGDRIVLQENGENLGYSGGLNLGFEKALERGADYLLISNNDVKVHPGMATALVKVFREQENVGFVTGKVYDYEKPKMLQTIGRRFDRKTFVGSHIGEGEEDTGQYEELQEMESLDDVFMMTSRKVVETVGGYDPVFFIYWEETDWLERAKKEGFRLFYTPDAKLWHKGSLSSGGKANPFKTYWLSRNSYIFMRRHASRSQWRNFLLRHFLFKIPRTLIVRIFNGQFATAGAFLKGNLAGLYWTVRNLNEKGAGR